MLKLKDCFKVYTTDQDKAAPPAETVARVKARLEEQCPGVLEETKRVDTGRLGIPVFLSICGPAARAVMPTRKQMGKGASPEQAEASALMELVERFSYFSFWADEGNFTLATWSEAEARFGASLMDIGQICQSVEDGLTPENARRLMDLVRWRFCPALNVATGETCVLPLDWFKTLNEFNGSSAGNTPEESVLQGGCELVERHVSALIDRISPELPTINQETLTDPVLCDLCERFRKNGILLILKDFSLGLPVPTVAALAFDPKTFPALSEIVYTAGTAASPVKAAVRAVTEVAQLAGDFETARVYEASGLRKFTEPGQFEWLARGPVVDLDTLPSVEDANIRVEVARLADGLLAQDYTLYTVETTRPDLAVPANYNLVPGFDFRERTANRSLGLFVGRKLAEEAPDEEALAGLAVLAELAPEAYYLPFFQALLALRLGDIPGAAELFSQAEPVQPGAGGARPVRLLPSLCPVAGRPLGRDHASSGPSHRPGCRGEGIFQPAWSRAVQGRAIRPGQGGLPRRACARQRLGPGPGQPGVVPQVPGRAGGRAGVSGSGPGAGRESGIRPKASGRAAGGTGVIKILLKGGYTPRPY